MTPESLQCFVRSLQAAVRPITTLVLVLAFAIGFLVFRLISPEVFSNVVSIVVGFWFGQRNNKPAQS